MDLYDNVSQPVSITSTTLLGTGINDLSSAKGIKFYPNPVSDQLILQQNGKAILISLIDMNGKVLLSKIPEMNETSLNVKKFGNGLYVLKVDFNDGKSKYFKIVKK